MMPMSRQTQKGLVLGLALAIAMISGSYKLFADDTEGWRAATSMAIGRGGAAVVAADGVRAYVIGGFAPHLGDSNLNLEIRRHGHTIGYSFASPAPTARAEHAAAEHQKIIYLAGGRAPGGPLQPYNIAILNTFEAYDTRKDKWQTLRPMPTPRAGLGLAAVGKKLYAIGGRNGGQGILKSGTVLSTVEVYDINTGEWASGPSMPTPRSDFAIAVQGNRVYVIGGWDGTSDSGGDLATVEVLDVSADGRQGEWSTLAPMPTPRTALAATVKGNSIYALGGHRASVDAANGLGVAEVYDIHHNEWDTIAPLPTARAQLGAATLGSKVYAIGGGFYPLISANDPQGSGAQVEAFADKKPAAE